MHALGMKIACLEEIGFRLGYIKLSSFWSSPAV